MSGRCVPPRYGSLRIHASPGPGRRRSTAATASGIAPRCTGMCSACITIWPSRVEQRGGGVAPLLDVGRVRAPARARRPSPRRPRAAPPSITCSVTGSTAAAHRAPVDSVPVLVDGAAPARRHDHGRLLQLEDRRAASRSPARRPAGQHACRIGRPPKRAARAPRPGQRARPAAGRQRRRRAAVAVTRTFTISSAPSGSA